MGRFTSNGISVHVSSDGEDDRPAILMSNSLAADLTMWDSQAAALSQDFRTIRYDTRGHGQTEATTGGYSLDLLVDDVVALLDTLGIPAVHFIGLSLGGMIGQLLGAREPHRLLSLTLCATFAQTSPDLWMERIETVSRHGLEPIVEPTLERWFTPYFRDRHGDVVDLGNVNVLNGTTVAVGNNSSILSGIGILSGNNTANGSSILSGVLNGNGILGIGGQNQTKHRGW